MYVLLPLFIYVSSYSLSKLPLTSVYVKLSPLLVFTKQ